MANEPISVTAVYELQYMVSVEAPYGASGDGWHPAGGLATISVPDSAGSKIIFKKTFNRHSPDRTTFPGYSSRRDAANYNLAFQGRQMRPDSLKFLLPWTNHRPAKRKISKPLVYDQVSSLGSPFALYHPVTVINPDAPKVD